MKKPEKALAQEPDFLTQYQLINQQQLKEARRLIASSLSQERNAKEKATGQAPSLSDL